MLRIGLPDAVTDDLYETFAALPLLLTDSNRLLARLLEIFAVLPVSAREQLLAFRSSPHAPTAALISGLPIDRDLPPTPVDGVPDLGKQGQISECAILTVALLLGDPVAYRAEKHGVLVQNVYPTRSHSNTPSNESSATPLGFHTELTFSRAAADRPLHAGSPDFVLLLGLRCPPDRLAQTAVVDAGRTCAQLSDRHRAALREPTFQLRAPYSFTRDGDGSRPWSPPVALLRGPADSPSLAFDTACGVRALTPQAEEAVTALTEACNDPDAAESVQLRSGDLLVINNKRSAHYRSSFQARFDGQDRWLQRTYVRRTIWPLAVESASAYRVLV